MKLKQFWLDRPLLLATLLLMGLGLVMVFSASAIMSEARFGSVYLFFRKQLIWDLLGVCSLLGVMRVDYHVWQRWTRGLLSFSVAGLGLVLVVGRVVKGARRWIHLGGITFQPSELAKLALILWMASYLDRHQSQIKNSGKKLLPALFVMGVVCGLMVVEPDLGTPLLLGSVCAMMLFMAGVRISHLLGLSFAAALPIYLLLIHVPYRRRRLLVFLNPWADSQGAGYQVTQSLMAFGSGGVLGKGLGASTLKLLYLPDPHTDFIFPIIGEELGFLGAIALILLFVYWGMRGWQVARRAPDLFGQLLASGITAWMLLQAVINMGVSCGLFPTKGLPLPFVSFGGSSTLISMIAVGILLNISSQGRFETLRRFRKINRQMSRA